MALWKRNQPMCIPNRDSIAKPLNLARVRTVMHVRMYAYNLRKEIEFQFFFDLDDLRMGIP